jgi:hypothetical protein
MICCVCKPLTRPVLEASSPCPDTGTSGDEEVGDEPVEPVFTVVGLVTLPMPAMADAF